MIRNIIFDFGGVIINIDPQSVLNELNKQGHDNLPELHQHLLFNNAYVRLETGELSPAGFREMIRSRLGKPATDRQIDQAWNAIIKDIPHERIRMLEKARKEYGVYLLSNTNPIHYDHYNHYIRENFGYQLLDDLFDKAYYSFRLQLYKPDTRIFDHVVGDAGITPGETLFIDDNPENVKAAVRIGLKGIHLADGMEVTNLFSGGKLRESVRQEVSRRANI